ncbi:MAG: diaminopimelate decarboxylase [Rhodobacteraceae bacterium]|nr:diaminopimelate decarboxylase [Paracoccaceae bacterium]
MDNFNYKKRELHVDKVAIREIASSVGTPFYVYSQRAIEKKYQSFSKAFSKLNCSISYAMKANSNQAILKILGNLGSGMDVVSGGEYLRAKAAGIPSDRIVFSGVGKTNEEIHLAISGGVRQFNVESEPELIEISRVASNLNVTVPLTIRVNPDIDAKTHSKISTGKSQNKFGIPIINAREIYAFAASLSSVKIVGIDVHIGSQILDLEPYRAAFLKIHKLAMDLRLDGHEISRIDLGGGLGIDYGLNDTKIPSHLEYGALVTEIFKDLGCEIELEPGRWIVGNSGLLISSVIYLKKGEGRDFLIVDAAMNDLIRPALYEAHHEIIPIAENIESSSSLYDVVGPVCETGDTFAVQREIIDMKKDDLLAFKSAGAYAAVMASEYNTRPLVPEVLVNGDKFLLIRARPTIQEMIDRDQVPDWL